MGFFRTEKNKDEREKNIRQEETDRQAEIPEQAEEAGMVEPEISGLPEVDEQQEVRPVEKMESIDYKKIRDIFHEELVVYNHWQQEKQKGNNQYLEGKFGEIIQSLENTGGVRQEIISRQQATIQEFQRDLSLKFKKELLMELIALADNIRVILSGQKEIKEEERDYDELLTQYKNLLTEFRNMEKWVEATLEDNAVRSFRDAASPSEYNKARQEIVETEETEDPELDGKVIGDQPGYIYTQPYLIIDTEDKLKKVAEENSIPHNFSYVLRNEEVKKYRLKK